MIRLKIQDLNLLSLWWPTLLTPPLAGDLPERWIRREPVPHVNRELRLRRHSRISTLEPLIQPAYRELAPFNVRSHAGIVRKRMLPRPYDRLHRALEFLQ